MRALIRLVRWLLAPPRDVSRAWLNDYERRDGGQGFKR